MKNFPTTMATFWVAIVLWGANPSYCHASAYTFTDSDVALVSDSTESTNISPFFKRIVPITEYGLGGASFLAQQELLQSGYSRGGGFMITAMYNFQMPFLMAGFHMGIIEMESWTEDIGDKVRLASSNSRIMMYPCVRLQPTMWSWRPYADFFAGLGLMNTSLRQETKIGSTWSFDSPLAQKSALVFQGGVGAGLQIEVFSNFFIDLGTRYIWGAADKYYAPNNVQFDKLNKIINYTSTSALPSRVTDMLSFQLGLTINFSERKVRKTDDLIEIDRLQQKVTDLSNTAFTARISSVTGIYPDGNRTLNPTLVVEKYAANEGRTLLPYIFFENTSAQLAKRYTKLSPTSRANFRVENLAKADRITLYRNILNIIGKRMTENTTATLSLTGCNADFGSEEGDIKLSKARAESVAAYLRETWQISPERLIIQAQTLPKQPSPKGTPNGNEENRRVEIASSSPEILAPVQYSTEFRVVSPDTLRIGLDVNAGRSLKGWDFSAIQQNGNEFPKLKEAQGNMVVPQYITWTFSDNPRSMPESSEPVTLSLNIVSAKGSAAESPLVTINVQQVARGKQIEIYDILTSSNNGEQSAVVSARMIQAIKDAVKNATAVKIIGHNRVGEEAHYNQERSLAMARQFSESMGTAWAKGGLIQILAAATDKPIALFYPEERLYSCFVQVIIESLRR